MVREFVEDFSFIMIDTKEEDDIFDEFEEIMNLWNFLLIKKIS